jgi:MOSC domain-containing protein YiiM
VFVYQMDSYHYWEGELKRRDFSFGQFGENFTVEGLAVRQRGLRRRPLSDRRGAV